MYDKHSEEKIPFTKITKFLPFNLPKKKYTRSFKTYWDIFWRTDKGYGYNIYEGSLLVWSEGITNYAILTFYILGAATAVTFSSTPLFLPHILGCGFRISPESAIGDFQLT